MFGLEDVDTIVHVDATLSFEWDGEEIIDHIEGDVGNAVGGTSDGEIIDLTLEENAFAFNESRVQAWFVDGIFEVEASGEDAVDVFFPKAGRFWMALHSFENWDNITRWDGRSFLVVDPPIMEGAVGADVETLFGRRSFAECVGDVRPVYDEVFCSDSGVENPGSCVVNTVGVGMVEDSNFAMPSGAVARHSSLLTSIQDLLDICPDKIEHMFSRI